MSVIRQDPTTKEWVVVAESRGRRPRDIAHDGSPETTIAAEAGRSKICPFCPGNESHTPADLLTLPTGCGADWRVRVIPNKFAALAPADRVERRETGPFFREMSGVGRHEVVIETPVHDRAMAHMTDVEVETVLKAYQARHRAAREDQNARYVLIFKNHGVKAGTSLAHPHSQVVATPVAPLRVRQKHDIAIAHYDVTGRCLYCDVLEAEAAAGTRVVLDRSGFVVFQPFASRAPFETWIMPRRHQASFGQLSQDDLGGLARVLRVTLRALWEALDDPDFNLIIHSAPFEDEDKPYYLWHVQIVPRLATLAGFELGSGMHITTVAPETSVGILRELVV